jgi:hypothetical protein
MKKLIACAIAALSFHANSQANVVYEWQGNNDATPYNITMRMEFSDAAVEAGRLSLKMREHDFDPQAGLVNFYYKAPGKAQPITYATRERAFAEGDLLEMDIVFLDDLTLAGGFKAINVESHIFMESVSNLFTVTYANSDATMIDAGCTPWNNCAGGTGVFRQVPEPGSMALVGLGLLGLARHARSKRKKAAVA